MAPLCPIRARARSSTRVGGIIAASMGGNLFKLGRRPRGEYLEIEAEVRAVLDALVGDGYRIPRYYASKPDFGDLDVVVSSAAIDALGGWEAFRSAITTGLGVTASQSTGHVYSTVVREFQVDYFVREADVFEATANYLAFNDVGNLLGKIYRRLGLKYGEHGLSYVFRRASRESYKRELPISRDWPRILALIGLTDKQNAYARTLSGGMRRRLLLGKALVHAPQVLVLDEPTAGVDIELRQMLWTNVRELNRQGMTIILTTHYLEEAQEMCDEIAIIDRGRLVVRDTTANIVARVDAKTLLVRLARPVRALDLPPGVTREDRGDGWLAFAYPQSRVQAGAVLAALHAAGAEVVDIRTTEPDLEDAFLAFTRHPV